VNTAYLRFGLNPSNGNALAMYTTSIQSLDNAIAQQQSGIVTLTGQQVADITVQRDVVKGRMNGILAICPIKIRSISALVNAEYSEQIKAGTSPVYECDHYGNFCRIIHKIHHKPRLTIKVDKHTLTKEFNEGW